MDAAAAGAGSATPGADDVARALAHGHASRAGASRTGQRAINRARIAIGRARSTPAPTLAALTATTCRSRVGQWPVPFLHKVRTSREAARTLRFDSDGRSASAH